MKPDFRVTNTNAPAVAEICARLDGLPLAIELAAARVKLLSPEQMLTRLEMNLSILSSPAQDIPQRQRTLRGAIDWSHDLLREPEQRLFARLAVFRDGCTLDAAEEVCSSHDLGIEVLEGISSLVDNSLLRTVEGSAETRFAMLETIREYARERLAESAAPAEVARRHAGYFFVIAHQAGKQLMAQSRASGWRDSDGSTTISGRLSSARRSSACWTPP